MASIAAHAQRRVKRIETRRDQSTANEIIIETAKETAKETVTTTKSGDETVKRTVMVTRTEDEMVKAIDLMSGRGIETEIVIVMANETESAAGVLTGGVERNGIVTGAKAVIIEIAKDDEPLFRLIDMSQGGKGFSPSKSMDTCSQLFLQ